MSIKNDKLKLLIKREEINEKISELAEAISNDFENEKVLLIGVLKGAFIFMADLIRNLDLPIHIDFIEISSYGKNVRSSGKVNLIQGINKNIKNKNIIIVEDIIDTGNTMSFLLQYLKQMNPRQIKICTLTSKSSRRKKELVVDYLGFEVPDKFIVGYGLDYKGKYRNLPEIYYIEGLE